MSNMKPIALGADYVPADDRDLTRDHLRLLAALHHTDERAFEEVTSSIGKSKRYLSRTWTRRLNAFITRLLVGAWVFFVLTVVIALLVG